jgi:hypothetical protein
MSKHDGYTPPAPTWAVHECIGPAPSPTEEAKFKELAAKLETEADAKASARAELAKRPDAKVFTVSPDGSRTRIWK